MLQKAKERSILFHSIFGHRGTHRKDKPKQKLTGFLAEIAIKTVYPELQFSNDMTVDFFFKTKTNSKLTFDSKAQGCNSSPHIDYVGTLYKEQKKCKAQYFIFSRVSNNRDLVWITGFISKERYINSAILVSAGVKNNNFTYDEARYELEYMYLHKPGFLRSLINKHSSLRK